jgi:hypothetical protein
VVETLAVVAGIALVTGAGYALWRAMPVMRDGRGRGVARFTALRWAVQEVARPGVYWWGDRLEHLRPGEAATLVAAELARLGAHHVTDARCGLCGAEMPGGLILDQAGNLTARRESICAACGFRLDACRFCVHFQPRASAPLGSGWASAPSDESQGRCEQHKTWQSVEQMAPHLARRLREMGYDGFNTFTPIQDSYVPLDECRAFAFDEKKVRRAGLKDLGDRRAAVVRLAQHREGPVSW